MNRFSQTKIYLDEAIDGGEIGRHGPFWRGTTRNEFVVLKVFNFIDVVQVGDGDGSNLIKALRGDGFPQMPIGFPPLPEDRIRFIEQWIDDGCPSELSDIVAVDPKTGGGVDPVLHNAFWRELDNWSAFYRTPAVNAAVGVIFGLAAVWQDFARGNITEAEFVENVRQPDTKSAIELLGNRQMQTVESHYGNPVPLLSLLESFELFGRGTDNSGLPVDPLRPLRPNHQMDGQQMWFNWCAMAEGAQRLDPPLPSEFWHGFMRAILLGLLNDGVIRQRFQVDGFSKDDPDVSEKVRDHVLALADARLGEELRTRFAATSLRLPF